MVAQRQPVDRVIDLVVGWPVATAVAARRSIPLIRQASRQGIHGVAQRARHAIRAGTGTSAVADSETVSEPVCDSGSVSVPATSAGQDQAIGPLVDAANVPAGVDSAMVTIMPIDDYDHLAARQVVDRLATLTSPELAQIELYERAHRHRQTVLGRIAQLQS